MPTPTLGTYAFLPWLRRGMATQISRRDGDARADTHATVPVSVTLNTNLTVAVAIALRGPGEVSLLDHDGIVRVYPKPNAFDVESNYFPLLEFEQPDLPWRYTPASASATDRLRPWICLVTLADDEITGFQEADADGKPAIVTVASGASLPDLAQSWAWAHVQVSGEDAADVTPASLQTLLSSSHERFVSRLVSPRRLEPNRTYRTLLVPAFERGRVAGLGDEPTGDGLTPAWTAASSALRLPVFHSWRFGTGVAGDFEYLARQVRARPISPGVGTRPIDVSDPGLGLPLANPAPLMIEGALVPPQFVRPPWSGSSANQFRNALASLLNLASSRLAQSGESRIVGPPLYGRWHARRDRVTAQPPWFPTLNVDPRYRVMAGAGALVVQAQQRQLIAGAWQQVAGIREANERLRFAQVARAAAERVFLRHVTAQKTDVVVAMTSPLHAKVMASPTTIAARMATSPVPGGALSPQLRRVTRPLGPIGRRLGLADKRLTTQIVPRLNRDEIPMAPPPSTPDGAMTPADIATRTPADTAQERVRLQRARRMRVIASVLLWAIAVIGLLGGLYWIAGVAAVAGGVAFLTTWRIDGQIARLDRVAAFTESRLTAELLTSAPLPSGFTPVETPLRAAPTTGPTQPAAVQPRAARLPGPAAAARTANATPQSAAMRFRDAAADVVRQLSVPAFEPPPVEPVSMAGLQTSLQQTLRPDVTFAAAIRRRLKLSADGARQPGNDPLEPVMAAPQFPQPMYKPLAELSQEWILPGLGAVPQNTATLVETNHRAIEGYMVGLSHEMARELQWNEYPTDMRGTYFRQFWDATGYAGTATPEQLRDITEIHTWTTTDLGANSPRDQGQIDPSDRHIVLLVRAELLRRYPRTIVYAVKTVRLSAGRDLGTEERHPLFRGSLDPDVTFFGFDLTAADVRGVDDPQSPNQGWYFVFQEQPTEPRFGLDVPSGALGAVATAWSDLSWGHLAATEDDLRALTYIDLDADLPDTRQIAQTGGAKWHANAGLGPAGATAAHLAYITLQQPMRVAIHGSDMIAGS